MDRILRIAASAVAAVAAGCQPPCEVVQLTVAGAPQQVVTVRALAQLAGGGASKAVDFTGDLGRIALRTPAGSQGTISIFLEGIDAQGCVAARAQAQADLSTCGRSPVPVTLTALVDPLCDCTTDGWCRESPTTNSQDLNDIFAVGMELWAVGKRGAMQHSLDGGQRWTAVNSGTTADLNGVWGSGPTHWWAVGAGSTVLRWDGTAWKTAPSPQATDWYAVWGMDDTVWLGGDGGAISRYTEGQGFGMEAGAGYRLTSGAESPIYSLWGPAKDQLWAVGGGASPGTYGWGPTIMHFQAGAGWSEQSGPPQTRTSLRRVIGTASGQIVAVGGCSSVAGAGQCDAAGVMLTSTGNGTWTKLPLPTPVMPLRGLALGPGGDFWAVGGAPDGHKGLVLDCNGTTCSAVAGANQVGYLRGAAASGSSIYAVGDVGDVALVSGPKVTAVAGPGVSHDSILSIWAHGPTDVWAVGVTDAMVNGAIQPQGLLRHWDGASWTRLTPVSDTPCPLAPEIPVCTLYAVFGDGQTVWVAGERGSVLQVTGLDPGGKTVTLKWHGVGSQVALKALWGAAGTFWAGGQDGTTQAPVLLQSQGGQGFKAQTPSFFGTLTTKAALLGLTGIAGGELWVAAADNTGTQQPHLFHQLSAQDPWVEWSLPSSNGWPSQLYSPASGTVIATGDSHSVSQGCLSLVTAGSNRLLIQQSGTDQIAGVWGAGQSAIWGAGGGYQAFRDFLDQDLGLIVYYDGTKAVTQVSGTSHNLQTVGGADLADVWVGGDGGTILRRRLPSPTGP